MKGIDSPSYRSYPLVSYTINVPSLCAHPSRRFCGEPAPKCFCQDARGRMAELNIDDGFCQENGENPKGEGFGCHRWESGKASIFHPIDRIHWYRTPSTCRLLGNLGPIPARPHTRTRLPGHSLLMSTSCVVNS